MAMMATQSGLKARLQKTRLQKTVRGDVPPHPVIERLVCAGAVGRAELEAGQALAESAGMTLVRAMLSLGVLTEEDYANGCSDVFGLPRFGGRDDEVDPGLLKRFSIPYLRRHDAAPLSEKSGRVLLAVADPYNEGVAQGAAFALGVPVDLVIATPSQVDALLHGDQIDDGTEAEAGGAPDIEGDLERLRDMASAEPAVRLCNRLVEKAVKARASDIHIEAGDRAYGVRLRVDGALSSAEHLDTRRGLSVISRLKILAALDIAERRRPQDGRFSLTLSGRNVDIRMSTVPGVEGEGAVLRLLETSREPLQLPQLGFNSSQVSLLSRLIERPYGILLLTGPTGSGKTTTLYALLQQLKQKNPKILTVEDPVEYRMSGLSQIQVNPAIGLDFAAALRSFLRQDPDILMVGEMRDLETVRVALQAAMTGHLVLSTLHTNDAAAAVARLVDMGAESYLVASALIGVVGQRLVRRSCHCRAGAGQAEIEAPADCPECHGTGYRGRIAIAEILEVDDRIAEVIRSGGNAHDVFTAARRHGFQTMREDGQAKVSAGATTESELGKMVAQ